MQQLIAIYNRSSLTIKIILIFILIALIWEYWPIAVSILISILLSKQIKHRLIKSSLIIIILIVSILIQIYRTNIKPINYPAKVPALNPTIVAEPTGELQINPTGLPTQNIENSIRAITPFSCQCSVDNYDCSDFESKDDAQRCFVYCGGSNNDIHKLDIDQDYIACNNN